jgi:hypothetical protein
MAKTRCCSVSITMLQCCAQKEGSIIYRKGKTKYENAGVKKLNVYAIPPYCLVCTVPTHRMCSFIKTGCVFPKGRRQLL